VKKVVYISNVKLDSKSGQNSFSMNLAKEFLNYYEESLVVCPYKPLKPLSFYGEKNNFKWLFENSNLKFLKLVLYQCWLIYFFTKNRRKMYFVFSIKPYMFSAIVLPMVGAKFSVFVEGLIPKTTKRLWPGWASKVSTKMIEFVIMKADIVTAAYESACEWMRDFGRTDVKLIPCGVSPRKTISEDARHADFDICYIGSFRDVHMLDLLIAFANEYHLSVCLVGDGCRMKHIKGLTDVSMGGSFFFTGHVPPDEVFHYVNRSLVGWGMCDPAHHGVPMKVAEYASVGISSIVSSYENFHWLHDVGACFSPKSFELFNIYRAFNKCKLNVLKFSTIDVLDKYSWRNFSKELESVINAKNH
jgi:hypothetical protein